MGTTYDHVYKAAVAEPFLSFLSRHRNKDKLKIALFFSQSSSKKTNMCMYMCVCVYSIGNAFQTGAEAIHPTLLKGNTSSHVMKLP